MTLRKLMALCATIVAIGLSARAADYTTVFSQDFEDAKTYANEMRNGSFANAALGTTTTTASELTVSVSPESVTLSGDNKGPAISWESRTKGDGTGESHYFRWGSYGKSTGHLLFALPESCQNKSISDYRLSFDYFLSSSYANKNSASNGLAIVSTSGATLATFAVPPHQTTGFLFKGDNIEAKLCDVVAGSRGTFNEEGSWLHIEVRGIRESGVFLTVTRENAEGTVYVADKRIADAFDTVGNIFLRSEATSYAHYTQIDNVLFETVMPSTYTWTGAARDNMWVTPANWTVRGEVPSQPPVRGDYVEIAQEALDAMDVAVLLEADDQGKVFVETFSRTTKYWTNATRMAIGLPLRTGHTTQRNGQSRQRLPIPMIRSSSPQDSRMAPRFFSRKMLALQTSRAMVFILWPIVKFY